MEKSAAKPSVRREEIFKKDNKGAETDAGILLTHIHREVIG